MHYNKFIVILLVAFLVQINALAIQMLKSTAQILSKPAFVNTVRNQVRLAIVQSPVLRKTNFAKVGAEAAMVGNAAAEAGIPHVIGHYSGTKPLDRKVMFGDVSHAAGMQLLASIKRSF